MDSKSLIAAALAPNPSLPDPGKQVKNGYSDGPMVPGPNVARQKVSSAFRSWSLLEPPCRKLIWILLQSTVPASSGKKRRHASSGSSQTLKHQDNLPVQKKTRTSRKHASAGEKLVKGHGGNADHHRRTPETTHKNSPSAGSSRNDNKGVQGYSVSTKQLEQTKKPVKPMSSSYVVSQQELTELEVNPNLVVDTVNHHQKVRSEYAYNKDLGHDVNQRANDRENDEFSDEHTGSQLQDTLPSPSQHPVKKKPCLIISSDHSTPSPPRTPSASPQHEPEPEPEIEDNNNHNDNNIDDNNIDDNNIDDNNIDDNNNNNNNDNDNGDDDDDDEYTNTQPSRRRKSKTNKAGPNKSKSKARVISAKNRKQNFPVASTISEASEADKMMFRMKGQGKSWKEITAEWTRMTGHKPGFSTLSVRFGKLQEKFARMGDMDVRPFVPPLGTLLLPQVY